jgi:hypothetical protein|tara:strand:+ start:170 stop:340 length:171 start_codon:yes stop_codon:yes gene_type:complete
LKYHLVDSKCAEGNLCISKNSGPVKLLLKEGLPVFKEFIGMINEISPILRFGSYCK